MSAPEPDDLLNRLKEASYLAFDDGTNDYQTAITAAHRIESMKAENARLRETLRTVAAWCVDAKVLSNKGHAVSAHNLAAGILRRIDTPT